MNHKIIMKYEELCTDASDQIKAVALVNSPCREVEILRDQANGNKVVSKSSIFEE